MKVLAVAVFLVAQVFLSCAALAADTAPMTHDGDVMLIDFGEAAEPGWIRADAGTKYTADRGYGFTMVSYVRDVPAIGQGAFSDAVRINYHDRHRTAFRVDLPDGVYDIFLYSGSISYMNIDIDGYPAVFDLAGTLSEARIEVTVTDGHVAIGLDRGASGMVLELTAMTIQRRSGADARRPHIFILGDSIAAVRYPYFLPQPFEESWPGGWGQMLGDLLPEYYVDNISVGGRGTGEQLAALAKQLHPAREGDYVIISLGINDFGVISGEEFKNNLKEIITVIRNMGCRPIVMSDAATLREYNGGGFADMCYAGAAREAAEETDTPFFDLHARHAEYLTAIGGGKQLFLLYNGARDRLHPNREGAGQLARLVYEGFSGLTGTRQEYDVSDSALLRCRIRDKNTIELINTAPYEIRAALISPEYVSGSCGRVRRTAFTLPAYDPLAPEQAVIAELSGFNPGCDIRLMTESGSARITYDERIEKK